MKIASYINFTKEADVGLIKLNRPDKLNALSSQMMRDIIDMLLEAEGDSRIRVIILTGTERAFCVGADITEEEGMTPLDALKFNLLGQKICSTIQFSEKPIIASISGYALGGGLELALACDFRICSSTAVFGFPEVSLSVTTGWGGSISLVKMVGPNKAKEMLMLGKQISADEALEMGIVNQVVKPDNLEETCEKLAKSLTAIPHISLALMKHNIHRYCGMSQPNDLSLEAVVNAFCYSLEEKHNAYKAFLKRKTFK